MVNESLVSGGDMVAGCAEIGYLETAAPSGAWPSFHDDEELHTLGIVQHKIEHE